MKGKKIKNHLWEIFSLLVAMGMLIIAVVPALADTNEIAAEKPIAINQVGISEEELSVLTERRTACTCERSGALGREGGALGLLGIGQPNRMIPKPMGAAGTQYTLHAIQSGSASYVIYTRVEDMGRDGGALALLGQR